MADAAPQLPNISRSSSLPVTKCPPTLLHIVTKPSINVLNVKAFVMIDNLSRAAVA